MFTDEYDRKPGGGDRENHIPSRRIGAMTGPDLSSGDILADRRLAYAAAAAETGDHAAAADILRQTMELVPNWAAGWLRLGLAEERLDDRAAAIAALARARALDPAGTLGAELHLARLGAATPPARAPDPFVRALFDQYAGRFDTHLTGTLAYRAPALLADAVARVGPARFRCAIDLGCGTGLAGALFAPRCDRLEGVDLSPGMIAQARAKHLYAALHIGEIGAFLADRSAASADLLIAADVLVYVGDLMPVLRSSAVVLAAGGLFAFTLQRAETGCVLGSDLRFAHAPALVARQAAEAGLTILLSEEASSRRDAGRDVPGLVIVCRRG
jgi:predicted TPR repeat methyltransferase